MKGVRGWPMRRLGRGMSKGACGHDSVAERECALDL